MGLFILDKIVWLLGVSVFLSNSVLAQTATAASGETIARGLVDEPSVLTLRAAEDLALRSNADLAVALRELQATEGAVMQSAARPNPELAFLLEDTRRATRTTTLQLNQPIELGGKRAARLDAATRGRELAAVDLATRRAEIRASVTGAFFAVLSAQERIRLAQLSSRSMHCRKPVSRGWPKAMRSMGQSKSLTIVL